MVLMKLKDAITTQEFVKEHGGTISLLIEENVSRFTIVETGDKDIVVSPVDNPEIRLLATGDDQIVRADIGSSVVIFG